jgi:hypothetical protein
MRLIIIAAAIALSGCGAWQDRGVYGSIPDCSRLVPKMLTEPVEGVDLPVPENHGDGHEKAEPWMLAYLGQTGQLDKANKNAPAVDHIYRECLSLHLEGLDRAKHGWLRRLFD